jgi:SAM-dependent methyltransferase
MRARRDDVAESDRPLRFDPVACDLCRQTPTTPVVDLPGPSMLSDCRAFGRPLRKVRCAECGLVRNAEPFAAGELSAHYRESYQLASRGAAADSLFFTPTGPVPRSRVFADWIIHAIERTAVREPQTILEVGCGEGRLLERLAKRWRTSRVRGLDLSPRAVAAARAHGQEVHVGGYHDAPGDADLIVAVAVIEHTPSLRDFLATLRTRLAPGGMLVCAQPCQDRGSSDIFIADHLFHFDSGHITRLAADVGLRETLREVGTPLVSDFALHVLTSDQPRQAPWSEPPASTGEKLTAQITMWLRRFRAVDAWLERRPTAPIAVWGVGQTFSMLRVYTGLGEHKIAIGLDENPARFESAGLGFPVVDPFTDQAAADGMPILVTFPATHRVVRALEARGVDYHLALGNTMTRIPRTMRRR